MYIYLVLLDAGSTVKPELIAGVVAAVSILLIFLVAMLVWLVAKHRYPPNGNNPDWTSVNPNYMSAGADGKISTTLFG